MFVLRPESNLSVTNYACWSTVLSGTKRHIYSAGAKRRDIQNTVKHPKLLLKWEISRPPMAGNRVFPLSWQIVLTIDLLRSLEDTFKLHRKCKQNIAIFCWDVKEENQHYSAVGYCKVHVPTTAKLLYSKLEKGIVYKVEVSWLLGLIKVAKSWIFSHFLL